MVFVIGTLVHIATNGCRLQQQPQWKKPQVGCMTLEQNLFLQGSPTLLQTEGEVYTQLRNNQRHLLKHVMVER